MGSLFNNNLFSQVSGGGGGAGGTTNYDNLTNKPQVNGIVLSGNKTSADLGITTLTPFPSTWPTTGKFEDLLAAIRADTIAVKGASFLGEVTFDDLPANLGNAEIKVEILEGTTSATKVIHSVITSGNREPYRWEYTSWNSGNSNSGWISFQLPLTAGNGISIENNVISTTGGADVPEDVYTQSNLLAGKGIEIVNEPVEGGIDEHTLACWHFDGNLSDAVSGKAMSFSTQFGQTLESFIKTDFTRFGSGSLADRNGLQQFTMDKPVTGDFTVDFWLKNTNPSGQVTYNIRLTDTNTNTQWFLNCPNKEKPITSIATLTDRNSNSFDCVARSPIEPPVSSAEWTHNAFTYNHETQELSYWFNGKQLWNYTIPTSYVMGGFSTISWDWSSYDIFRIDEYRISDIVRYHKNFESDLPRKEYSVAVPTGNKVINNTGVASVNTKTGDVTLTAADINVTYTHEGAETTSSIKEFADTIDHDIENLNNLMPVNAVQSTTITTIVKLTQAEYDALETKDDKTLYYIV